MPTHQQGRQEENDVRKKPQTGKPGEVNPMAGIDARVVQQARLDPRQLSPVDVLQLQRMLGNRAINELSPGTRPGPEMQAKLTAGPAHDQPEQKASQRAVQGMSQSLTPATSLVQRTLMIDPPNGEFAQQLIADLKKLLTGTKGYEIEVSPDGGVTLKRTTDEVENSQPGFILLSRVISSEKSVRLLSSLKNEKNWTESKSSVEDSTTASNRKGSNVVIFVNPEMLQKSIVKDRKTEEIKAEDSPSEIVLAHELIHAERAQRGVRAAGKGSGRVEYPVKGKFNNKNLETDYGSRVEEVLTVGLEPTGAEKKRVETDFGTQDITENKIREQLDYSPIVVYESDIEAFFKRIETIQSLKTAKDKPGQELPAKQPKEAWY
jgi:hypothetical protein